MIRRPPRSTLFPTRRSSDLKMRKAQERMLAARPYSEKIRNIAVHLGQANPEYVHPFMQVNGDAKTAGVIVVTTDKGLCGGMNTNVLRAVTAKLRELQDQGVSAEAVAIGNKGLGFLNRVGAKVVSHATGLGDTPHLEKLIDRKSTRLNSSHLVISYAVFCLTKKND